MDERTSYSNYNLVSIAFKLYSFNKDFLKIPDCTIRHTRFNSGR